jgi:hypothetical protein
MLLPLNNNLNQKLPFHMHKKFHHHLNNHQIHHMNNPHYHPLILPPYHPLRTSSSPLLKLPPNTTLIPIPQP